MTVDAAAEQVLEQAAEIIERAKAKSRQPRFASDASAFFGAVQRWLRSAKALEEPDYAADSRKRDKWLAGFWQLEPHLAGVLNSVIEIDKNRGWTLTGGRNQVHRYTEVAHNYWATPELCGWRPGLSSTAQSFYIADIGGVVEEGRDGSRGPLRALYHVDPTLCKLTGKVKDPLRYHPPSGKAQDWSADDYFRVVSMPDVREKYRGLGFCAVGRCLELAKIMVAIYQHDQEMLGARMPKGILLFQGVGQDQWDTAMQAREAKEDSLERDYFGGVFVLATEGMETIDAKLIALSQLPANFDLEKFTNLLMFGYALAFGYDPSEFWPVQFGALGRGQETAVQHLKATGKGGMSFVLSFQERFQRRLPDTLQFEFEQRSEEGQLLQAQVAQAWANVAATLAKADQPSGVALLGREQALSLLADQGIIPPEWTEIEEEAQASDTEEARSLRRWREAALETLRRWREAALESPEVRRAVARFPDEPIIRYRWPENRMSVLWERGRDALSRSVWRGATQDKERQDAAADVVLYRAPDGDFEITQADVDRAIETGRRRVGDEFGDLLEAQAVPEEEV